MLPLKLVKKSLLAAAALSACAQLAAQTAIPAVDPGLRLATPISGATELRNRVLTGPVQVAIRLTDAPLALAVGTNAKRRHPGRARGPDRQRPGASAGRRRERYRHRPCGHGR